jgi:hypothetical protein
LRGDESENLVESNKMIKKFIVSFAKLTPMQMDGTILKVVVQE